MSSKTKIFILKKREAVYTAIFLVLGIILLILAGLMFGSGKKTASPASQKQYVPGVYTTPITLNNTVMDLEVRVNDNSISSIRLVNLSESVASMFPLVQPSLDSIASQIYETQSTDNIYYEKSSQYTCQMLLKAIDEALGLAKK